MPRKGYSRRADIPPELLAALNAGTEPTQTLAEGLAINFARLLRATFPDANPNVIDPAAGITYRMLQAAMALFAAYGDEGVLAARDHTSDTVRGWAAYAEGRRPGLAFADRLERLRPFAVDPHFGVREWAWMALRPAVMENLDEALRRLQPWTASPLEGQRRFASELTRPRGVWCEHIEALKRDPAPGRPLLDPLRADPSRYVQDSVANWLNDASKTCPAWVQSLLAEWAQGPASPATDDIIRRAARTVAGPVRPAKRRHV